ncbi:hypothetical protein [Cucumibacter marinus]|uniref:hypothetical protein n=1 Tax=Cucumibacter marinus TaxID=1121252 RepID=UPI00041CD2FB|nr:hypothetical protein [Cucumibacter marinus]
MNRLTAAGFAGLLALCAPGIALASESCVETWDSDLQPLVNSRCVACHQNASPAGKLTLQRGGPPENLIGIQGEQTDMAYVTPGAPEESYLYRKLEGTHVDAGGTGERMPLGGALTDADLTVFREWILGCEDHPGEKG